MASAVELFESRVGDVSADRDGFMATRLFRVIIDEVGDNPDDVLRDPVKVGNIATPFGEPHETRTGLQVAFLSPEMRLKNLEYIVRVIYAPPIDFSTPTNPWELSWSPGFGSVMDAFDFRGDPIGMSEYTEVDSGVFHVRAQVTDENGIRQWETIELNRTTTKPVFLRELQRNVPSGSFALSRTFNGLHPDIISTVAMLGTTVNKAEFHGFPAGKVQFVGPAVNAGVGPNPNTNSPGFIWRVSLVFEWNREGFRQRFQESFKVGGIDYPVFEGTQPVIREVQQYFEGRIDTISTLIDQLSGSGQTPQRILGPIPIPGQPPRVGGGR